MGIRHLEFSQCGGFDQFSGLDLPAEPIVSANRPRTSATRAQPELFDLHALPKAPLFMAEQNLVKDWS